ncbi:MAG: type III-A CRISPR-associated RAMP protein Csm3 [Actinobacteria bacterium]|nr:type III-A CRISPR-associated RAMP protein Csm3 [Actinomycetota bacterium]
MAMSASSRPTTGHLQLMGRVVITGNIRAITGLRIGSSDRSIGIGEASPVLRDALTTRPYIPGSSLRGKLRSLAERIRWHDLSRDLQSTNGPKIHQCPKTIGQAEAQQYRDCPICPVFGVPSDHAHATPTRLMVRDMILSDNSANQLYRTRTELPYTEVKYEVAIDRITAASNPREIERVPAGAVFSGLDMSFSVYEASDVKRFAVVAQAMALLEDDYLGGHGARGYGRIEFTGLKVTIKDYRRGSVRTDDRDYASTYALAQDSDKVGSWINETLTPGRSV